MSASQAIPLQPVRRGWRVYFDGAAILAWVFIAVAFGDPIYDELAVTASVLMLAATLAFVRWRAPAGRDGLRLLGVFVCGQTFVMTGFSVVQPLDASKLLLLPTTEAFSFAVESSFVFSLSFMVGAFISGPRAGYRPADASPLQVGVNPRVAVVLAALTAIATLNFLSATSATSASRFGTLPIVVLNPGMLVPMLIASDLLARRKAHLPIAIILLVQATITLFSSAIGVFAMTLRDIFLARICLHKRLPVGVILIFSVAVLIINPAKLVFRNLASEGGRSGAPSVDELGQTLNLWGEALDDTWSQERQTTRSNRGNVEETARRLDYNWVGAHIYTLVPNALPFELGDTYEDIPLVLVPRILYPDKPMSATHTRTRWLVRLGIQTWETGTTTAVAVPAPAESYWNFGWPGVVFVPVLLGMAVGGMLRLAPRNPVARVGYIVILATSIGQFMDMLVWIVPGFVVVGASAVLSRFYCRIGNPPERKVAAAMEAENSHA